MKSLKLALFVFWTLLVFTTGTFAQELPTDAIFDASVRNDQPKAPADVKALELASISSTASGGLWSSPSTWEGGVVPGASDNVLIVAGSAVVIDTAVAAANLTIGDGSLTPAVLTFDPNTARSLTVNGDLNIQNAVAMLATPGTGTITNHVITVGGNLTNNGVLDLSTNNNQAGAELVFINATSNAFSGNGPTTDVRAITVNKGNWGTFVIDVSVANFTVQGNTNDSSASGYLTVINGTFKISGTFSGNHRTFAGANYTVPYPGGFWLNNPNYNVTAQNGTATFGGLLHVSAGTVNIGTEATDQLVTNPGWVEFDGGTINIAGSFKHTSGGTVLLQTGGTMNVCTAGNVSPCLDSVQGTAAGGHIFIKTARPVPDDNNPDFIGSLHPPTGFTSTVVHFGNADTPPGARFTARGNLPNVILDTTTGPHTLTMVGNVNTVIAGFNIGPGGTFDIGTANFRMEGNTFVNNGTIITHDTSSMSIYCGDGAFTGTGSFSGPALTNLYIQCTNSFTFNPAVSGIRARTVNLVYTQVINAGKITIGNNDASPSLLSFYRQASLDSAPVFDPGTGGMKLIYSYVENHLATNDIPPSRSLSELSCDHCTGTITFTGGDISVAGPLKLDNAIFDMSGNRLVHSAGALTRINGYVRGGLAYKFTGPGQFYDFFVGTDRLAKVQFQTGSPTTNPTIVSVKPIDATLPGLPPATSASFSWQMEQSAPMTTQFLRVFYDASDVNGNESNYRLWRSSPQLPGQYSNSGASSSTHSASVSGVTNLNGTWGIGASIPNISISGRISTSNGSGIANATVILTGGNLTAPRTIQTGPFGTYIFNLEPGGEYIVTAGAKRYRFGTLNQIISSFTSVANVDFVANPQE